jgi:hypothetical protein
VIILWRASSRLRAIISSSVCGTLDSPSRCCLRPGAAARQSRKSRFTVSAPWYSSSVVSAAQEALGTSGTGSKARARSKDARADSSPAVGAIEGVEEPLGALSCDVLRCGNRGRRMEVRSCAGCDCPLSCGVQSSTWTGIDSGERKRCAEAGAVVRARSARIDWGRKNA